MTKKKNFPIISNIFSPDIVEEQRRIENLLHQEKLDAELAFRLQQENSMDNSPSSSKLTSTPKTSVERFCKRISKSQETNSSSRQLPLSEYSLKCVSQDSSSKRTISSHLNNVLRDASNTQQNSNGQVGEKSKSSVRNPSNFFKPLGQCSESDNLQNDSVDMLEGKIKPCSSNSTEAIGNKQFEDKSKVKSSRNPLDLLKRKVENDLNTNVASCSKAPDDDEIFARKLQQELNREMSEKEIFSKENQDAFAVLKSQKPLTKTCKLKHKTKSCNKCSGCRRENCGKCVPCRDMPKFGGKCVLKQKCVYRKCVQPVRASCSSCS